MKSKVAQPKVFYGTNTTCFFPGSGCFVFFPTKNFLVGGFNPAKKYDRQIGPSPQVRVKIKNI